MFPCDVNRAHETIVSTDNKLINKFCLGENKLKDIFLVARITSSI